MSYKLSFGFVMIYLDSFSNLQSNGVENGIKPNNFYEENTILLNVITLINFMGNKRVFI